MVRRGQRIRKLASSAVLRPGGIKWSRIKWSKIDNSFSSFEPESLVVLISAAADSPACGHRLPSLTVLWLRAVSRSPNGTVTASPKHLEELLAAACAAAPQLRLVEDCWNFDPRLDVRFPVGSDRLRFHPGALSDPIQLLRIVDTTASAIDTYVYERHGFALSDLLDVALRYSDLRVSRLSTSWPRVRLARDEPDPKGEYLEERANRISQSRAEILQAEMDAARSALVEPREWIRRCVNPDRALAAWEWSTKRSREVKLTLEPTMHSLGATLAIRSDHEVHPVPASLVLGALAASTALLASEAASDPQSAGILDLLTKQRVFEIFGMDAPDLLDDDVRSDSSEFPAMDPRGLGMLLVPTDQHAYAIGVVSGLDAGGLERALGEADETLNDITVEELDGAGPPIARTATVHRLVLYGGPLQLGPPAFCGHCSPARRGFGQHQARCTTVRDRSGHHLSVSRRIDNDARRRRTARHGRR